MRVFKTYREDEDLLVSYFGTRAEAKTSIKDKAPKVREQYLLEEVNVETDKDGVVKMLNGDPDCSTIRRWGFTARGGLKEEAIE